MRLIMFLIDRIKNGQGFPCLFHLLTGFYCPGCGGTRAIRLLLKGELIKSFCYHPFVPYLALVLLLEAVLFLRALIRKGKRPLAGMEERYPRWVAIGAAIILVNWIVKNVLLVMGMDLLLPLP
ncbi:MAG: DUF2752 domain-containing protein [Lachnospiraceae bacterium]|nr:DUF2752 domain-containing protein [Lachnospiraceae bacterium]